MWNVEILTVDGRLGVWAEDSSEKFNKLRHIFEWI
jgi:hypothetical protein